MVLFPAPIGGTVLPDDFAPSILFAVLYAALVPLMLHRMLGRRSRCTLLIGTIAFAVERVIILALRAVQARSDSSRFSEGLVTYQQISFGMGFIGIASDAVKLAKCLLVNATYGPEKYPESPAAATKEVVVPPPSSDTPDQPKARSFYRRITGFVGLAFLGAVVTGIIANSNYSKDIDSQANADLTAKTRIASTAIAVGLSFIVVHITIRGFQNLPRISKRGVAILGVVYTLMIVIGIYRLSVMWLKVTSLSAQSPLNTPGSKALFYIFHVLPEWLASVILLGYNIRKTFGTGLCGDWRLWDETEKERVKRLARIAKREAKREAKRKEEKLQLVEEVEMKGLV